jgi:hypothetical protein
LSPLRKVFNEYELGDGKELPFQTATLAHGGDNMLAPRQQLEKNIFPLNAHWMQNTFFCLVNRIRG